MSKNKWLKNCYAPAIMCLVMTEYTGSFFYKIFKEPVFITFLALATGLLAGRLKIRGFTLGSSAVFFTGLILGVFNFEGSGVITTAGLVIFMYAMGIQGGPGFFNSLGRRGIPYLLITVSLCLTGLGATLAAMYIFHLSPDISLGIFTGSLTSSSSLAVLSEGGWGNNLFTAYGMVYPVGLFLPVLFIQLLPLIMKKDLKKDIAVRNKGENAEPIVARKFMVERNEVNGKTLSEIGFRMQTGGATLSRIRRRGRIIIPGPDTILKLRDIVLAVGTEESIEKVHKLLGNESHDDLETDPSVEAREIIITNPSLHEVALEQLDMPKRYHTVITRIWRGGIQLVPTPDFVMELGDSILAVGKKKNLDRLCQFLGKEEKTLGEVDFLSMAIGITAGMIIGQIKITIPSIGSIMLGNSGGAMLTGMFLGYVRRLGFLTGQMSPAGRTILKELGLDLFLAGIGIQAGANISSIGGLLLLKLILSSIFILISMMTVVLLLSYRVFKMSFTNSLACVCGSMTSTPAVVSLNRMAGSEDPSFYFASCYPLSVFGITLISQIIAIIVR
ncbi:MAG: TrkA C-terminal domain-containing protein [Candidatus Eremiobacterota bacterium]